jgi:type IV pilus assembly protein PilW
MMLNKRHNETLSQQRLAAGFTLVELMIALVLGLLVIAGVGSVFLANQSAYRSNVALGDVQESARTSFEFLARQIRAAGANPCGTGSVDSVLNAAGDAMLDNNTPIEGWDDATTVAALPGSGAGRPVAGDAIRLSSARSTGLAIDSMNGTSASVKLQNSTTAISAGNILMLCDVDKATMFQVSSYSSNNQTLKHESGGANLGNQTKCLNHPVPQAGNGSLCTSFSPTSYLAVPTNYIWYVGANDAGGRSLYRFGRGQSATSAAAEMVRGVSDMTVRYHEQGGNSFVAVSGVGNWENVDAVRLVLTVRSGGSQPGTAVGAGTDSQPLERVFTSTVALRNRLNNN